MLDTGDLILMQHVCHKSFTPLSMAQCLMTQKYKEAMRSFSFPQEEFDSSGIIIRNREGAKAIFKYYSDFYELDYDEFLKLPFFSNILLRKMKTEDPKLGYVKIDFADNAKNELKNNSLTDFKGTEVPVIYWEKSGFMRSEEGKNIKLGDLAEFKIKYLDAEKVKYLATIVVRTEFSRKESKNY